MGETDGWAALWRRAQFQHNAFDLRDATRSGVSPKQVQHRARTGEIPRLHRGVYASPGSADTDLRRASAALLAVRGPALLGGRTAGALWGMLDGFPSTVELLRADGHKENLHRRVMVRHSGKLVPRDRARKNRLPVTSAARTLADLAGVLTGDALLDAAAAGLQRRVVTVPAMEDALARMTTARGVAALREAIALLRREGRTDSPLERDVRRWLFACGFRPEPEPYPLSARGRTVAMLDVAFPRQRVCIECDSRRWHSLPEAFHADRARWNAIQNEGWIILYLTHRQFTSDRERRRFREQLAATLRSR